jgi:hypothetical protein
MIAADCSTPAPLLVWLKVGLLCSAGSFSGLGTSSGADGDMGVGTTGGGKRSSTSASSLLRSWSLPIAVLWQRAYKMLPPSVHTNTHS